jgi:hypothetical protein
MGGPEESLRLKQRIGAPPLLDDVPYLEADFDDTVRKLIWKALDILWGPRLTVRNSRYAYNSRSQETVVNPHNRVGITNTSSIT